MWLARDFDNTLYLFEDKPIKVESKGIWKSLQGPKIKVTDKFTLECYKQLLWNSKPVQVTLMSFNIISDVVTTTLDKTNLSISDKSDILSEMIIHDFYIYY